MARKAEIEADVEARDPSLLLGGERRGLRPQEFDLGNSPREYTPAAVEGRVIVFSTTNGTRALRDALGARETLIGAFLNLPAVADYLVRQEDDVLLVAVGRDGGPVLDDIVCAGMFVDRMVELAPACRVTDAARMACFAYQEYRGRVIDALRRSPSGQDLIKLGLEADLADCAQIGVCDVVPQLVKGEIRRAGA